MDVDITPIMQAVIALVSAVITVFLIPYIKTKLNEAQRKRIKEYIDTAVMAAEKLFPSVNGEKLGEEKLQYVADYLKSKGIEFDVGDVYDDIRIMIESAVKEFAS